MAEQSVRHTLMVVALMQCASETLNTGEDASGAATRCIDMFRQLFPGITRDELRSALAGAEQRRSELNALRWVDSAPDLRVKPQNTGSVTDGTTQSAPAESTISDRVSQNQPIPELPATRQSRLAKFILRHANRSSGLLLVAFPPFQSEVAEQLFEMLIFPPIALLHVIFTAYYSIPELIIRGRLLIKPAVMRLPPAIFLRLSRQRAYNLFDRGIRTGARLFAYTERRTTRSRAV